MGHDCESDRGSPRRQALHRLARPGSPRRLERARRRGSFVERGPARLYTIGHSTRSLEVSRLLTRRRGHISALRLRPAPAYPHFSGPNLERSLIDAGSRYTHMPSLGGRRRAAASRATLSGEMRAFELTRLQATREFSDALDDLLRFARLEPTAHVAPSGPVACHACSLGCRSRRRCSCCTYARSTEAHQLTSFGRIALVESAMTRLSRASCSNRAHFRSSGMLFAM